MTRILIVDDDRHYRYALRSILPWEDHGCRIEAEAVHGRQALAMLEYTPVDIVITDISMPKMNGVELIRAVRREYPSIELIALSSYDDFAFVKEAMKHGARDYILKYEMKADDILRVVNEARQELMRSRERPRLDSLTDDGRSYLAGGLLRSLLEGAEETEVDIRARQFFHLHRIHGKSPQMGILVARGKGSVPAEAVTSLEAQHPCPMLHTVMGQDILVLIVNLQSIASTAAAAGYLSDLAEGLMGLLHRCGAGPAAIGVGPVFMGYEGARRSCRQALAALEEQVYSGYGSIYRYEERERRAGDSSAVAGSHQALLTGLAERAADLEERLAAFWGCVAEERPPVRQLDGLLLDLCAAVHRPGTERHPRIPSMQQLAAMLADARTLEEKRELVDGHLARAAALRMDMADYSRGVRQAAAYLRGHYAEELSVNGIAEQVGLSPNYLGSLFRSETGERITEYLNRVRVENAKGLLLEGTLKNYEIAERVGFESASYFSTIFKKVTGLSIQQFRNGKETGPA